MKLNRLQIGHCLFTHKHIIEKTSPPECKCKQTLTINHIFNECLFLKKYREKYNINGIINLANENHFENVKKFLTAINLFNLI